MKKIDERRHMLAFGYGIALIIPFVLLFRTLHALHGAMPFSLFLISFVFLLFIINGMSALRPVLNLWIFAFIGAVAWFKMSRFPGVWGGFFLTIAFLTAGLTVYKAEYLRPLYHLWMPLARFVGICVSGAILTAMFFLVFAPVGIFLRLRRKDLLDQKIEPHKDSYWIKRADQPFDQKSYQQQF